MQVIACPSCGHVALPVSPTWSFVLPLNVPSHNRSSSRSRHGGLAHAYRKLRDTAAWLIAAEARRQAMSPATGKRRVRIVRLIGKGKRAFDRINWAAGAKPIMDGLVKAGLLVDDSEKWVDDEYAQEKAESDAVRVEVWEHV